MALRAVALAGCVYGCFADQSSWPGGNLQRLEYLLNHDQEALVAEIKASPLRAVVPMLDMPTGETAAAGTLPTVLGHGMGDSCWEPGMMQIGNIIGKLTGSYHACIPTGGNIITDTLFGFFKDMDSSVDIFAAKIKADPKLAGGFNAIGFSQGNSLIRGYIHKYNDPPVNAWVSVHGTVQGVAALPNCFDGQEKPIGFICSLVAETLGDFAYNPLSQHVLFQADYYRAANQIPSKAYLANSQIAHWNNEDPSTANATFKANFAKTKKFAMVKALHDSMVYPNEGEWWGAFEEGKGYKGKALAMKETKFYQQDLFGLKTADEAGKFFYETTPGDHLQMTIKEITAWVNKYFIAAEDVIV